MIEKISTYITENLTLSVIVALLALLIGFLTYRINRRKYRFDKTDFENKKSKFKLYLENCYKFQDSEKEKFLLFDIRITNYATTKNSLIPKLRIIYFVDNERKSEIVIEHKPSLFHNSYHDSLTKFPKEIRIEDKQIISGWVIFNFPQNLLDKRIDYYELSIEDGSGNHSNVICNLIKQIVYENQSK